MTLSARKLVDLCVGLGSVPVALFTNGATAVLQKLAECNSVQEACAQAHLPGGAAIPVACVLGALGLTSAAIALKGKQDAAKVADEFAAMAKDVKTIDQVVRALAAVLEPIGDPEKRLSAAGLQELGEALATQDLTKVTDGTAQRMMLVLEAAGLAKADVLNEMAGYTKETWLTTLHIREDQEAMKRWVREADERIRGVLEGIAQNAKIAAASAGFLEEEYRKGRMRFVSDVRDNLTAANVPNNAAKFKGRIDDLKDLHRRVLTDPDGVPIPVIGAPGLGKSALVTRYVYFHHADFDHVWWLRASNPKGNTAGSAEERSLAALLELWGIESKAITRDAHATRVDALADEVRKWLSLPRADGSPVRHLVVLDNVDDYATVKRLRLASPSRVVFTGRAASLVRDGAAPINLRALSPEDGLLVLRANTSRWNADRHTTPLTELGELVDWNALALVYLGAMLSRPSTSSPALVRDALVAALAGGGTGPRIAPRPEERPDDHDSKVVEAIALCIAPYAELPEMVLLDFAALCAPDSIALDLLRAASGLEAATFGAALDELVSAGVLDLQGNSVNIHRLTQISVRRRLGKRAGDSKSTAQTRLLDALVDLFKWPETQAEQLLDHTKTPTRLAALAHAEVVVARVGALMGEGHPQGAAAEAGAPVPLPRTPSPEAESNVARLRSEMARRLRDVGQLADAARHIDAAIHWGEAQFPRDDRNLAVRYATRASIRQQHGLLKEAEEDINRSIDWEEAQAQPNQRELAVSYASRASIRKDRGLLKEAEEDINRSIDWDEAQSPRDERSLAIRYATRAGIRHRRGLLREAEKDINRSIDWNEAQSPRDERSLAIEYASRAGIRKQRGLLKEAAEDIEKSIDWGEGESPRDERGLAICYASRATIRHALGLLTEAEEDINRSIDWDEGQSPRNEHSLALGYSLRAGIRLQRGMLKGAEEDIKKSIDWGEAQSPRDERSLAIDYAQRARIRDAQASVAQREGDSKTAAALFMLAKTDTSRALTWMEKEMPHYTRGLGMLRQALLRFEAAAKSE